MIEGAVGHRQSPIIASSTSASSLPPAPKRKALLADIDRTADDEVIEKADEKIAKKTGDNKPDSKARPSYCFASLIKGFDLTTVQCRACSDESNPVRCDKGLHVDKSDLPSVRAVIKSLASFKSKVAQEIVMLLKSKK